MSRREPYDVIVVGAGMVGACAALLAAQRSLRVALIESQPPPAWQRESPDLRVVAFAPDSAALLQGLGLWQGVLDARAQDYRRMHIWDAAAAESLQFDARDQGLEQLGWIVENGLLIDRLWQALQQHADIRLLCPATLQSLQQDQAQVSVELSEGPSLQGRLVLAADGAHSPTRRALGIEVDSHDYQQRAIVAFVDCELPHQATCYQRFLPGGPLAFLPFADGRCSIVWSLPDTEAERLLAVDDAVFCAELERAFDSQLGAIGSVSARRAFPLRRQLARSYAQGRVMLLGDAAHVVHPLAGQGVNLGLRDVAAWYASLDTAGGADIGDPHRLQRLARARRSDNALAAYAFEGLNHMFSNEAMLPTLLRGPLLGLANRLPPLKSLLLRRAIGAS